MPGKQLLAQARNGKNKLYSLHESGVDCISKGNLYDGHTLANQLQQVETLSGHKPAFCFVDRGYKGSGVDDVQVIIAGQKRGVPESEKRWMRRRNSVAPVIGYLKSDGKMRGAS